MMGWEDVISLLFSWGRKGRRGRIGGQAWNRDWGRL